MIEETATVVAINGNQVVVKSTVKSSCHSCEQQDNCGSGQIAKAIPHKTLTTTLQTEQSLAVGDEVVIGLNETSMLKSALHVYLAPLFGLILGASIGQLVLVEALSWHELSAVGLATGLAYLGYLFAKKHHASEKVHKNLQPKLLRKCQNTIPVTQI